MRKERKIINTNIRLNLCDEQDRQAWEYLQTMDREKYKSYTRAVVVALNDYFSREYRNEADPYLETREKEDAFLERVETAVRDGVKESVPMAIAKNLMEMLVPFVKESVGEINLPDRTLTMEKTDGEIAEDNLDWEKEADMDAFEKNIDEKSQYIDKIVFLDDGFEEIYTRVKEELDGNRAAYTEEIQKMKDLISMITERSMKIQVQEQRNKELAGMQFSKARKKIRQVKAGNKAATQYYKNMQQMDAIPPQFLDKKK